MRSIASLVSPSDSNGADVGKELLRLATLGLYKPRVFLIGMMLHAGLDVAVSLITGGMYPTTDKSGASVPTLRDSYFVFLDWYERPFVVISLPKKEFEAVSHFLATLANPFYLSEGVPHMFLTPESWGKPSLTMGTWSDSSPKAPIYRAQARTMGYSDVESFPFPANASGGDHVYTFAKSPNVTPDLPTEIARES